MATCTCRREQRWQTGAWRAEACRPQGGGAAGGGLLPFLFVCLFVPLFVWRPVQPGEPPPCCRRVPSRGGVAWLWHAPTDVGSDARRCARSIFRVPCCVQTRDVVHCSIPPSRPPRWWRPLTAARTRGGTTASVFFLFFFFVFFFLVSCDLDGGPPRHARMAPPGRRPWRRPHDRRGGGLLCGGRRSLSGGILARPCAARVSVGRSRVFFSRWGTPLPPLVRDAVPPAGVPRWAPP